MATMYVDDIQEYDTDFTRRVRKKRWSHLATDGTEAELVAFAVRIGCAASWIQHQGRPTVHFDLTPAMRARAIKAGAIPLSSMELARRTSWTRRDVHITQAQLLVRIDPEILLDAEADDGQG
jgi:hypothetical protein